jgi:hypothetical protein
MDAFDITSYTQYVEVYRQLKDLPDSKSRKAAKNSLLLWQVKTGAYAFSLLVKEKSSSGVMQKDIAKQLGVSKGQLTKMMQGKAGLDNHIPNICNYFNVKKDFFSPALTLLEEE